MQIDSNPNASIDSDKFSDVQFMQKQIVDDLTKQVPGFGKFFQYYLENDPLSYDAEIVSID